jgi:SnoaL-like domain
MDDSARGGPRTGRAEVAAWVDGYERAWRTAGTAGLAELFSADVSYSQGPYREPVVGLPALARVWEAERDGPDEAFRMAADVVAVDGDTAVVRVEVWYEQPVREYRDLWVLRFDAEGRCRVFEEWPFWPDQPITGGPPGD